MSKIMMTIVGNRPQFIKLAPISKQLKQRGYEEFIVHTGQHYDYNLSQVFFDEMDISPPTISLTITEKEHGKMTAEMLVQLEEIFIAEKPQGVLLFGDTNSTLAAALAAIKLKIPIAHVESGPRTHDFASPEEINRVIADRTAKLLFCPDLISVQNLAKEGITQGVYFTGDVMYDSYLLYSERSKRQSTIIEKLQLTRENYILLTVHRPNNTDVEQALLNLIQLIAQSKDYFVFALHPRTEIALKKFNLWEKINGLHNVKCTSAVGYLDLLALLHSTKMVITDSGGLSKEAYFAAKPTLLTMSTTPWPQIKDVGWQKVVGTLEDIDINQMLQQIQHFLPPQIRPNFFGDGNASSQIVNLLEQHLWLQ